MQTDDFTRVQKTRRSIVRSRSLKPVVLIFHHADSKDTYVNGEKGGKTIGLPHKDVFAFDQEIYERLMRAFSTGNPSIRELYERLSTDEYACNKYQDDVRLLYGEEHIGNSECTSGSHSQ